MDINPMDDKEEKGEKENLKSQSGHFDYDPLKSFPASLSPSYFWPKEFPSS
jgi:hypothetical protein